MRYFKCNNGNIIFNTALKEQYKILTEDEKRIFRKRKRWKAFSLIVFFLLYFLCFAFGIYLLVMIPLPNHWFMEALVIVGKMIIGFIIAILSGGLSFWITTPLWNKLDSLHTPSMKKELFSKACKPLREYYRLTEPYIVTKCFDATDKSFQNHDVCIFAVDGELRITTDIIRGFLHGERDLGCYAFKFDEITLTKALENNRLVAELKADNTLFLLGYRAKSFIEKLINKKV